MYLTTDYHPGESSVQFSRSNTELFLSRFALALADSPSPSLLGPCAYACLNWMAHWSCSSNRPRAWQFTGSLDALASHVGGRSNLESGLRELHTKGLISHNGNDIVISLDPSEASNA